ncbi:MAG: hypothetical protein KatS3mg103_0918 [Phycisphaerales bacterium]|nr:MAG: hypothetical protein KatS3mg103_0918 [Phycisphaerales bacterium]
MKKAFALVAVAGVAAAASAQSVIIDVANPTLNPGESTTVTLSAGFAATDYAMAGILTNLISSVGSTGWSDLALIAPMDARGYHRRHRLGHRRGRHHRRPAELPPAMIYADPTNPIAFWSATYTAPAVVDDPFTVDLSTRTERFDVYIARDRSRSESRLADLVEGSGAINVVARSGQPGPAGPRRPGRRPSPPLITSTRDALTT